MVIRPFSVSVLVDVFAIVCTYHFYLVTINEKLDLFHRQHMLELYLVIFYFIMVLTSWKCSMILTRGNKDLYLSWNKLDHDVCNDLVDLYFCDGCHSTDFSLGTYPQNMVPGELFLFVVAHENWWFTCFTSVWHQFVT